MAPRPIFSRALSRKRTPYQGIAVGLIARDRELIKRCLHHEPGAWNDFVDRFLGLVYHVVQHTADMRSYPLTPEDKEDVASQVLVKVVENDYAALRHFRGKSSLASYLTVIARRTCVNELANRAQIKEKEGARHHDHVPEKAAPTKPKAVETLEEVRKLLNKLPSRERAAVRLFYLEGRSYEEISTELNIPVNSVGAILARARKKLRGED
jgi:RNA polymerase sigma-70 factor (ECF subfamily)